MNSSLAHFTIAINSRQEFDRILNSPAETLLLQVNGFGLHQQLVFSEDQVQQALDQIHASGKLAAINLLSLLEENQVTEAEAFLKRWKDQADLFYVSDDGWLQYAKKYDCLERFVMFPETLIASDQDSQFYLDLGVKRTGLMPGLPLEELLHDGWNRDQSEIMISGRIPWMVSRRPLLSNYLSYTGQPEKFEQDAIYTLKEKKRQEPLPMVQHERMSVIYGPKPLQSFDQINDLFKAGYSHFLINSLFEEWHWSEKVLDAYRTFLDNPDSSEWTEEIRQLKEEGDDSSYFQKSALTKKEAKKMEAGN